VEKLAGRTALVTGGASGIGLGIAGALVGEGARVVLCDWKANWLQRQTERLGDAVIGQHFDVRDRDGWQTAKRVAEDAFGPVEILINNAGVMPGRVELADMPVEHFDRLIGIMLVGMFNGIHTFAAGMRDRGDGHIVNTASMAGLVTSPRMGAYTTAKFAVVGMSEVLRAEMDPHGVGVSVLCPGLVRTNIGIEDDEAQPAPHRPEMEGGMDPAVVGARVLEAIRTNELYVLTHGGYEDRLAARADRVQEAAEAAARWEQQTATLP
jgi:NAD(P)-dependent dehydrogenase (short-subunit alcohol dehydrogenase family)